MSENSLARRVDRQSSVTIESPDNPFIGNLTLDDDNMGVAMVKFAHTGELMLNIPPSALHLFAEVINELLSSYEELRVTELGEIPDPDSAQPEE